MSKDCLFIAIILAFFCSAARADVWEFFYPEFVTSLSYKVEAISYQLAGSQERQSFYVCEVSAERKGAYGDVAEHWGHELSKRPETISGRRQATRDCEKWMEEAEKRIKKAKGLK